MADPAFFKKAGEFALGEIAQKTGATLVPAGDDSAKKIIRDVAPLSVAGPETLSFLDNLKYREDFLKTNAGACFVTPEMAKVAPAGLTCLVSPSPYKAYAQTAQLFYPETLPKAEISERAWIHPLAKIGEHCVIEAGACVEEGAQIGNDCWIEHGAVIGRNVRVGNHCRIGTNASVSHAYLGDHVRLYPGVRVGQDGFGFAIDPTGHVKVPQLGRVVIGDHVEIGANTTIDRGAGPDTVIGSGTWIDNLVQIGHNVEIGRGCIIVAQVGISGSTKIDDFVAIGGQVGVAGHLKIGKGARIGAQAGVMRDVPPGEEQLGSPAYPSRHYFRQIAALNRLIQKKKGV
ncbi:MAG: UDP-3-O-(3-hydroxymyristoyl)glucosamine N-acyltransferase [Alphaproteobacteria bacterium]|nr:UDP-3-O-(3-hydroxymyristoyl)glucosamine N-acyltransferase [Alphaproteobacteria bacterium]